MNKPYLTINPNKIIIKSGYLLNSKEINFNDIENINIVDNIGIGIKINTSFISSHGISLHLKNNKTKHINYFFGYILTDKIWKKIFS